MARGTTSLFVYGTLRSDGPAHGLIAGGVRSIQPARCRGVLYALPQGYPALVEHREGWALGEVLELAQPVPWGRLDAYEQCDPARPFESLYHRVRRPVTVDGVWVQAWCYVMPPDRSPLRPGGGARRLASGWWPAG